MLLPQFLSLFTAKSNRALCLFESLVSLCYNPSVRCLLTLFFQEADRRVAARTLDERQMSRAKRLLSLCLQQASSTLAWIYRLREMRPLDGSSSASSDQDAVGGTQATAASRV